MREREITEKASLPEIEIKQVIKSTEAVVKVDRNSPNPDASLICPYGDYTVVLGKGINRIQILDKQGRKIEDLDNNNTMVIDWQSLKNPNTYYSYMAIKMNATYYARTRRIDTFPENIRPFLTEYIKKKATDGNMMEIPDQAWELSPSKTDQMVVRTTSEGYILIRQQDSGVFVVFQTRSPQGIELPPRNWKRFDNVDKYLGKLPPDIEGLEHTLSLTGVTNANRTSNNVILVYKDKVTLGKFDQKTDEVDFTDKIIGVGNNLVIDPRNYSIVYYCSKENPASIIKLDTRGDPAVWQTEAINLPQQYKEITNLALDPSGNFFTFESNSEFVILSKDDFKEVKKIPNLFSARVDQGGMIRGIDENGYLVVYNTNFQEVALELEERRVTRLTQGLATDLFQKESVADVKVEADKLQHLVPVKIDLETKFADQLQTIANLDDISIVTEALSKLRQRLQSEGLQPGQIEFITQGIQDSIHGKERILAAPVVAQGLVDLNTKLAGNLTIAAIAEAKGDIAKLKSLEGLVDDATRAQIRALESQFGQQSVELFRREGAVIEKDVGELVTGVKGELEKMMTMPDFADWQEFRLPQLVSRLGSLANDCPIEAYETQRNILGARRQLQELSREYETKFKERYAQVREKASEIVGERVELMKVDMGSLADRLRARGFKDRSSAETYVRSSEALEALKTEISELARQNPDAAKELDRELKVRLATIMSEIERGGLTSIAETGQQMILFGNTLFPRWEGKVQEKVQRHVDLIFIPDERTKGPGVSADKVLGDIGIMEINTRGKLEKKRLYENMQDENEWRYGSVSYRGEYVFPSYVSQAEYRKLKQDYADWSKGDASKIRQTVNEKRQLLHECYKQRQPIGERDTDTDNQWGEKYRELLSGYAKFAADSHVLLLSRVDKLRKAPETEFANGSGYVPEWRSEWTADKTTEGYLEKMAKMSKMQLDLQEGLLNLKGHAGTGKDVLVQMFANRTNRPYFTIDCSKWTTEFELSEDVVLEAEDGASKTVKVPSVVLNAITTPGAVMYFNEINAMPEQAQIFLHGLMDFKRRLTLKTDSGKTVKALDSVLLIGSMNPGYPGTFNPQFATKSRMVELEINYPDLYREKEPNDPNPNFPISADEALRVARQVDSLADFTYEANPQHNEFVHIWDKHINGIQNGAPDLTQVQKFDLEAILTMVEFAKKLREGFILKFEKVRASSIPRGTLLVDQPITGREMGRMAYFLSKMSPEEKAIAKPEAVIRSLIEEFFLPHIDKKDERDEIRTAMVNWSNSKRLDAV